MGPRQASLAKVVSISPLLSGFLLGHSTFVWFRFVGLEKTSLDSAVMPIVVVLEWAEIRLGLLYRNGGCGLLRAGRGVGNGDVGGAEVGAQT